MPKLYTKNTWTDEVLADTEKYNIKDSSGTTLYGDAEITLSTPVVTVGTAVNASKMNNIENGIDGLDDRTNIPNLSAKTILDDADSVSFWDSVASTFKRFTWSVLKTNLKSYLDSFYVQNNVPGGRLTLQSGSPVSITDQTAKTTLYYTPYLHNFIWLYTNSAWKLYSFSELSLSLSGLVANRNYDVFMTLDTNGAPALSVASVWSSDNITRSAALGYQDGVLVLASNGRRYLGTIRITATTGQCEDSAVKRFVWNYYNRVEQLLSVIETTSHTYAVGTNRKWNNSDTNNLIEFVIGIVEEAVPSNISSMQYNATAGNRSDTKPYLNGASLGIARNALTNLVSVGLSPIFMPRLGYNYMQLYESSPDGTTGTFYTMSFYVNTRG